MVNSENKTKMLIKDTFFNKSQKKPAGQVKFWVDFFGFFWSAFFGWIFFDQPWPGVPAHVENEAVPVVDVDINNTPSIRRSTRLNKGKTSRYNDYET